MGTVDIRRAAPDDAETLLGFVRALAEYEREPDAVEATAAVLAAQLAAEVPPFECLIASVEGDDVGMAIFFPTYSTWRAKIGIHLEDLWVEPRARRHGVARALMDELGRIVIARGGARLEWRVLTWNEPAIRFYRSLGAEPLDGWDTWRLDLAARMT